MHQAFIKPQLSRLFTFAVDGNEILAADKPTRQQLRRFKAHEKPLQAMTADPLFGAIAQKRLECMAQVLDYVRTGSELSRKKSIKLHDESDRLIDGLLANGAGG